MKASEIVVSDLTEPDNLGRRSWTARWLANNSWRGGSGVAGQIFHNADFDEFVARTERGDKTVRIEDA